MSMPHASWAAYYDAAYELTFGEFYHELTQATIAKVRQTISTPAGIVDFGAGTGRLSIPLASEGYDILAVEPCREMVDQLEAKARRRGLKIRTVCQRMQDFRSDSQFDMALCVFTVLLYLLDNHALVKAIQAAGSALRTGGLLLIDVPDAQVFRSYEISNDQISRRVRVEKKDGDIYQYEETTEIRLGGKHLRYDDRFLIRYWEPSQILGALTSSGFLCRQDLSQEFAGAGARYLLMEKIRDEA